MSRIIFAVFSAFVVLVVFVTGSFGGSCHEAKLCCSGRDSSCVVQKAPINAIIEDLNDKPCYCDHACLKLGDCCQDFKQACGVVDCVVSSWGPWSDCDVECGTGMTTRRREVVIRPENGGKHCPSLTQKRGCQGARCPHHVRNIIKETAMLLPIGLSGKRKINETADITRNLKLNYQTKNSMKTAKKEYCVKFEIVKTSNACKKVDNFTSLEDGAAVCVKCEEAAMRETRKEAARCPGHGVEGRTTRWEALSAPHCRGKWVRVESRAIEDSKSDEEGLRCGLCPKGSQFIFV